MSKTKVQPKPRRKSKTGAIAARSAVGFARKIAGDPGEVESQSRIITAAAKGRGLNLAAVHCDSDQQHNAFHRALDQACESKSVLIVVRLACLARSAPGCIRIARRLHASGADMIAIADGIDTTRPSRHGFFGTMEMLGGLEVERLRQARQAPFGYEFADDDEHLVHNPDEQVIVRRIIELRRSGSDCNRIAAELNGQAASRSRAPGRAAWDAAVVQEILDRHPTSRWTFADDAR